MGRSEDDRQADDDGKLNNEKTEGDPVADEKNLPKDVDSSDVPKPPLSTTISVGSAAAPPELSRAHARVIALHPGAMHVPGNQQPGVQDDEESVVSPRVNPQQIDDDVLLSAELVSQPPTNSEITAEVSPAPIQMSPARPSPPSSKPELVVAEPFQERQISLGDILKNRTVRIALVICLVLTVFTVTLVLALVLSLANKDSRPPPPVVDDGHNKPSDSRTKGPHPPPSYKMYPTEPPSGS